MNSASFLPRLVSVLVGACGLNLIAAPHGMYWLTPFVFLPMFWALRADTPKQNRWLAFIYGTVAVGTIFRWLLATITIFSNLPFSAALAVLGLYAVAFGLPNLFFWPLVHPIRNRAGTTWVVLIPCLQVLVEYVSLHVLLFPYNYGATVYKFAPAWQLLSITGVWGLTWLIFFLNASIAELIYRHREGRALDFRPLIAAVTVTVVVTAFGFWRYDQVEKLLQDSPAIRIAQLQSSKTMQERMATFARETFDEWIAATSQLEPNQVDLIVWPEGASPYSLNSGRAATVIGDLAKSLDTEMIVGGGTRERRADAAMGENKVNVFNSVYHFGRDGKIKARYDKMVPLPFGEYLPFAETFPWLADLIEGPSSFQAGTEPVIFESEHARIATPICYEAILTYVCQKFESPQLVVNVTNDAWFGDTAASHLHAMLAMVRSAELGVPMYRSAYTGTSMAIEPHGAVHSQTELYTDVNRVITVRLGTVPTLYRRFGDWFVLASLLVLIIAGAILPWRRVKTAPER